MKIEKTITEEIVVDDDVFSCCSVDCNFFIKASIHNQCSKFGFRLVTTTSGKTRRCRICRELFGEVQE